MIYSVWKPDLRQYEYYEDGRPTPSTPSARHIGGRVAADAAGWPLPTGVHKTGVGPMARGQVAQGLGGAEFHVSLFTYVGLGLLVYGLFKLRKTS